MLYSKVFPVTENTLRKGINNKYLPLIHITHVTSIYRLHRTTSSMIMPATMSSSSMMNSPAHPDRDDMFLHGLTILHSLLNEQTPTKPLINHH